MSPRGLHPLLPSLWPQIHEDHLSLYHASQNYSSELPAWRSSCILSVKKTGNRRDGAEAYLVCQLPSSKACSKPLHSEGIPIPRRGNSAAVYEALIRGPELSVAAAIPLSLDAQHACKKPDEVIHSCEPRAKRQSQENPEGFWLTGLANWKP